MPPDSVKMKGPCTLKAQANLSEEIEEVEFEAGEELAVLAEWENHYLTKNSDGKLFNVQKDLVEG